MFNTFTNTYTCISQDQVMLLPIIKGLTYAGLFGGAGYEPKSDYTIQNTNDRKLSEYFRDCVLKFNEHLILIHHHPSKNKLADGRTIVNEIQI